jgi:hypothetical protein
MWEAIRKKIKLGTVERSGKFLGCECTLIRREFPAGGDPWRNFEKTPGMKLITANCVEYNMEHFLTQSVEIYCTLAKISRASLKKVQTPFIDEAQADREWEKFVDSSLGEEISPETTEGFQGVIPGIGEIYKCINRGAKKYVSTPDNGPKWSQVIRRITRDYDTKEILDDIDVRDVPAEKLYGNIPGGPRDIETMFYYEVPPCTHVDKPKSKGSKRAKRLAGPKSPEPKAKAKDDKDKSSVIRGALADAAARVLMKVLYAARLARFDLLRAVGALASMITKWDKWQDRKLHKLMCYINCTLKMRMISWISDSVEKLSFHVYADADFAGDIRTMRSTSGAYTCLIGGNFSTRPPKVYEKKSDSSSKSESEDSGLTKYQRKALRKKEEEKNTVKITPTSFVNLSGGSRKQTAVSHSTPEAEIVAADTAIRTEGMPMLDVLEHVLDARSAKDRMEKFRETNKITMHFHEDNETCSGAIRTGRTPTMRHLNRTHRVDVKWLHDEYEKKLFMLHDCASADMRADIFTKFYTEKSANVWNHNCGIIGHVYPESQWNELVAKAMPVKKPTTSEVKAEEDGKKSGSRKAAAAYNDTINRAIIEFCCGEDSKMGQMTRHSKGCEVVRLTKRHDLTTESGVEFALTEIKRLEKSLGTDKCNILLWVSIPCTGGSSWQNYNKQFPHARELIEEHFKIFHKLWKSLEIVAKAIDDIGGKIAIEWPRGCSYWHLPKVEKFAYRYQLEKTMVTGCMVNLRSAVNGELIAKPWKIMCNSRGVSEMLRGLVCNHPTESHTPCAGKDTRKTESYTDEMVRLIHKGFRKECFDN